MGKIKIEVKKPHYLAAKAAPKEPVKEMEIGEASGVPGFFKLLLFLSYLLLGFSLWIVAQTFIEGWPAIPLPVIPWLNLP